MARSSRASVRRSLLGGGIAAAAGGVAVVLAVTAGGTPSGGGADPGVPVDLGPVDRVAALRPFGDCDALLRYYRSHAEELVGPYGLAGSAIPFGRDMADRAAVPEAQAGASAPAADEASSSTGTGTNVQVAGVDEADVAKLSDGVLFSLAGGRLDLLRARGGTVTRLGRLDLPAPEPLPSSGGSSGASDGRVPEAAPAAWSPTQLLVDGDRVLLLGAVAVPWPAGAGGSARAAEIYPAGQMRTRIAEVDVADPRRPTLVRTLDADGALVGARLVDGVARIAVASSPVVGWRQPAASGDGTVGRAAERKALEANRARARRSTLSDWLPGYTLTRYAGGAATGRATEGRLVDCDAVAAPASFSGLDTLSLLTLDVRASGSAHGASAVVANGSTLYATAGSTYVATSPWQNWAAMTAEQADAASRRERTSVHQFVTEGRTRTRYTASGSVPGFLLGQFAMDEHDGVLRVASTLRRDGTTDGTTGGTAGGGAASAPAAGKGDAAPEMSSGEVASSDVAPVEPATTESAVTVLQRRGDRLVRLGSVGGLGRTETIRAVRFLGDVGYVVTFRQTDPLYTIDLGDPREPRVAGELKIRGYSAYLHPAGADRLLGVGQDADADGRVTGLQMSLFDVSDPDRPRRVDTVGIDGAWSETEGDHHAFTLTGGLALTPYSAGRPIRTSNGEIFEQDSGVLAVRLDGDRFGTPERLRPVLDGPVRWDPTRPSPMPPAMDAMPLRTFVDAGAIYTVTTVGVAVHDASTLARTGFTRVPPLWS